MSKQQTKKVNRLSPKKDFNELLKHVKHLYTQEELDAIQEIYQGLRSSGKQKAKLVRPIVPIEEWLDDEYYVGNFKYDIYPYWKKTLTEIINSPTKINQVIFTGAIGTGKSTAAVLLLTRRIYELSCYENISALFKLGSIAKIAFAYLSVTREQAMNTGFASLQEMIDQIPYFNEHFPRKKTLDSALIWPQERLFVMHGSVANHFIGMNLAGSILDEANFLEGRPSEDKGMGSSSKVSRLYSQIINRAESRFIVDGKNESLSILVSSSTNASSFTEHMVNKHMNDPSTYIASPALWDVKPQNYKGDKFLVFVGGEGFEPQIVRNLDDLNRLLSAHKQKEIYGITLKEAYSIIDPTLKRKIIEIPEEHRNAFSGDIVMALQDLAGLSSTATRKFFGNNIAYNKCVDETLSHPFSSQEFKISTTKNPTEEGYLPISAYMLNGFKFKNPNAARFMHVDLAVTGDSIGISMGHVSEYKVIHQRFEDKEELKDDSMPWLKTRTAAGKYDFSGLFGSSEEEYDDRNVVSEHRTPIITIDFMLRINPPAKPQRMQISKIRDFIIYLSEYHNIRFSKITFDQWGSEQIKQDLTSLGYQVGNLSVDRNTAAYYALADLIYEERIRYYDYEVFRQELFNVVEDRVRNKIDHTPDFHKDVSDSVAGTVFNIINAEDTTDIGELQLNDIYLNRQRDGHVDIQKQFIKDITQSVYGEAEIKEIIIDGKKIKL